MLENIRSPRDLDSLSEDELKDLAEEIRNEMIKTVAENGGHLASNLGVVELTLALHRVFHMPEDKIVFDVGHQSYVHKLITGRYDRFSTLRSWGGLSGFPKRSESEYDCFETGHASTAISAALGLARARDYRGEKHQVIAVVGDGALTGGMCYEALNDAGNSKTRMIVVLNDNEMSIAPNVGALSRYLTSLRISAGYQDAKSRVRHLNDLPVIGKPLYHVIHGLKKLVRTFLVRDKGIGFFEALGFEYFGPISGHDMPGLERTFREAAKSKLPCVIHVLTRKGQGYDQAEERPETFHGTPPFYVETGDRIQTPRRPSWGHIMADTLSEMCEGDDRIVAITAAMQMGTGLDHFAQKHPDRLLDVGIAEEHAATLAAGLAAGGMRPYFAVYSSFFQRCYDQMIHDVSMQRLPVVFLLDRSGVGGEDGQTHHGLFDLAATLPVPGITVLAPSCSRELVAMLKWTLTQDGPCVIRYSRTGAELEEFAIPETFACGKWQALTGPAAVTLLATGNMVARALKVRELLKEQGTEACVVNASTVKPLDRDFLAKLTEDTRLFTLEEHMVTGGFGMYVTEYMTENGLTLPAHCFGVEDRFLQHGAHERLMEDAGLNAESIARKILSVTKEEHRG